MEDVLYNYRRQGTTAGCQRKVRKQFEKATERKAQVEDVPEMGETERETKRDRRGGKTWWSRSTPGGLKQTRENVVTPGGLRHKSRRRDKCSRGRVHKRAINESMPKPIRTSERS